MRIIFYFYLEKRKLQLLKLFDIYLTIVLALIILIGMLAPISEVTTAPAGTDKIIHILAFAALVLPLAITKRIGLCPLFIFASCFGAIIEVIQPSFGRSAEIIDWIADIAGVIFGLAARKLIST